MNKPSHDEIAVRAYQLWESRGGIPGIETETWLEAEIELTARAEPPTRKAPSLSEDVKAEASTPTTIKVPLSPAIPDRELALAEAQKAEARAPQVPNHTVPKAKPAPPGKPIWDKPHSA
jgi:hypothetical protein